MTPDTLPSRSGTRRSRVLMFAYVASFVALGAYQGLNALIGTRHMSPAFPAWEPLLWEMSSVLVIGAVIPGVVWLERQVRIDSRPRGRVLLVHAAAGILFSIIHTTGMVLVRKVGYALAGERYDFGNVLVQGFYELQKDLITYLLILVVILAVREFQVRRAGEVRAAELAAQLSEARLRHLTAQIEPHFLFNSLNAISNRMHEDVGAADRMISQLGDLLRAAYESDRQVLVPLERELSWLRGYAGMMSERFRGQLEFDIEVEPGLEALLVPRLLLQPLVENAIRHGLAEGRGQLRVEVRREGHRLLYTVADDGAGLPQATVAHGTGLSNIARRLELLFPKEHTLDLASGSPRGAVVKVSFPVSA